MANIHTVEFNGKTYTRTSQSRAYTHCVAVVRPEHAADGYTTRAWEGIETWCGSLDLARKAAATLSSRRHYDGTERRGHVRGRRYVSPKGNGPAIFAQVVVLPVTLQTKTPKAATPAGDLAKRKSTTARRASSWGMSAAYWFKAAASGQSQVLRDGRDWAAETAADAATKAWHAANERLALDAPAAEPEGAIVAPTVTADEVDGYAAQALNRMDDKGESIAEAVEAVIGAGRGPVFDAVVGALRGESIGRLDATLVGATHPDGTPAFPSLDALAAGTVRQFLNDAVDWSKVCDADECQRFPNRCDHVAATPDQVFTPAERLGGSFTVTIVNPDQTIPGLSYDAARHLVEVHRAIGERASMKLEGGAS